MGHRTLVIIPACNEEAALPAVLAELAAVVPDHDVLVVDDGSTDATSTVARRAGVRVARLPFNLGVGGAMRAGFRYAVERGYDRALQFDADGQHDAQEIRHLVAALDAGADLVIGGRFTGRERSYRVGRLRLGGMRLLRLALVALSGQSFSDTSSGFRGFSRRMLEFFAGAFPVEYLSDTAEALLLACYAGFEVVEVPVTMRQRSAGTPSTRSLRLVYHYCRLLLVMLSMASLRRRMLRKVVAA